MCARAMEIFIFHSGNSIEDRAFTRIHVRGESDSPCFSYLMEGGLLKKHLTITPAGKITYSWKKLYVPDEVIIAASMFSLTVHFSSFHFSSVTQSCPTLQPHRLQHIRPPCPSPTPRVYSNSCPLSWWCHPTISSSVIPFSCCPQSFPASESFQMRQLFASSGQSIGVSASTSVLAMNTRTDLL